MLVLVTGANGFVGSHLVEALLARNYRVRCMVRSSSDLTFIRDLPVDWAYADLEDAESLQRACQGVDAVCHCAALTRALDEKTFMQVNARDTDVLAQTCIELNPQLQRFLFVSSLTAVGPSQGADHVVDEYCLSQPITWYGKSKLAAERALQAMGDRLPLTIVRAAAVFGPRDRDFFTYFDLVNRGLELQLGRQERLISLIYVHDLIELLLLALESDAALGQTYIGCNQAHSYGEFSGAIARALQKRTLHIMLPEAVLGPMALWAKVQARVTGKPALLNEQRILDLRPRYWLCSGAKASRELGFAPKFEMETAVGETATWYLENGWL
jgi:nucleoside-diphosphate-sugar epimerase